MTVALENYNLTVLQAHAERFWSKVNKAAGSGPSGDCWVWTAVRSKAGYGIFRANNKNLAAHRVSLILSGGDLGDRLGCHKCDFPPCVRPEHIFAGTYTDNRGDCILKRRHAFGEKNGRSKLNHNVVREIKRRIIAGETYSDIARSMAIGKRAIALIAKGETWKHVEWPRGVSGEVIKSITAERSACTNARLLTINGVTRRAAEWATLSGVNKKTFSARLRLGWTPERAVLSIDGRRENYA